LDQAGSYGSQDSPAFHAVFSCYAPNFADYLSAQEKKTFYFEITSAESLLKSEICVVSLRKSLP
jgi:hypothetical protein